VNAHTSTARRATALAVAAALTFCTEGQALAAMAQGAGAQGQVSASAETPAAPTPNDLSAQAIDRFKAKDYEGAARLFDEAYKLDPNPNYLFNIGRVYEEKGDIRAAVDYYQRFVKEPGVELESRELALQRLRVLKAILQETDAQNKPPGDQPKDTPPVAEGPKDEPKPEQPPPDDAKPKKMRTAGFVLLGIGGVGMAVGGILGGVTLSKGGRDRRPAVRRRRAAADRRDPRRRVRLEAPVQDGRGPSHHADRPRTGRPLLANIRATLF
jgi:hypothetical protein